MWMQVRFPALSSSFFCFSYAAAILWDMNICFSFIIINVLSAHTEAAPAGMIQWRLASTRVPLWFLDFKYRLFKDSCPGWLQLIKVNVEVDQSDFAVTLSRSTQFQKSAPECKIANTLKISAFTLFNVINQFREEVEGQITAPLVLSQASVQHVLSCAVRILPGTNTVLWECCIHLKMFTVCSGCKCLLTKAWEALRRPAEGDGGVGLSPGCQSHLRTVALFTLQPPLDLSASITEKRLLKQWDKPQMWTMLFGIFNFLKVLFWPENLEMVQIFCSFFSLPHARASLT